MLTDLVREFKPDFIFLCETFADVLTLNKIKEKLCYSDCFTVPSEGHSGGLSFLWKTIGIVEVVSHSAHHKDSVITLNGESLYRLTGYNGVAARSRRQESWNLLRQLAGQLDLPWVVLGNFNDILHESEKRGGARQPCRLIDGFQQAIQDCHLRDLGYKGNLFTWDREFGLG